MRDMSESPAKPSAFGINLFGYLTANLGLGVAARNTAHMLLANGIPTRLIDVNPGGGMQGQDLTFAEQIAASARMASHNTNLFHINPDQVTYLLDPLKKRVVLGETLNVCVPFWELPHLPRLWEPPLRAMDAILAPTHFVEAAIASDIPGARCFHYPQAVHVPEGIVPNRPAFGIDDDAFVFVMSFDVRSDIERKNPWGTIEAFHQAFPERSDVRLVIKANNVETIAGLGRHVDRLREVAADPRVSVVDRPMGYREVLSLYASGDALVSLHRSEGLGLSLLEAMSLGKPVIATGWSGNMDFMTSGNSCPVGFDMTDVVAGTQPAYGKGLSGTQQWAEPRVKEAAEWMRRLAEEPELRGRIGSAAQRDAHAITARYDSGEPMLGQLRELTKRALAEPALHAEPARRMAALRRSYYVHQVRRMARAVARRTRTRLGIG